MGTPKFQPQDKITYIGPTSKRYGATTLPICYIVSGFSVPLSTYYVYTPNYIDRPVPIMMTQYDLEINFRLADQWEIDTYFG